MQWVESFIEVEQVKLSHGLGLCAYSNPPVNSLNTAITLLPFVMLFVHVKSYFEAESGTAIQVRLSVSAGWILGGCQAGAGLYVNLFAHSTGG